MPPFPRKRSLDVEAAGSRRRDFLDYDLWTDSKTRPGNQWRDWEGIRVTIFKRGELYGVSAKVRGEDVRFLRGRWKSQYTAVNAAFAFVEQLVSERDAGELPR